MKRILLMSAAVAAVPGLALAQAASSSQDLSFPVTQVDDVIVTATKREQTLQDVPVAVSVTSAETLERAAIRDVADLATVVPSLRVVQQATSTQTNFIIRGFGNGSGNIGIEPSVGVFIDGVYRSRSSGQIGDFPDVQRIEVLRGPQSTLFGKNASVGVISVVTREPQFSFGGNAEASFGNFDARVLKGVVTGPLSDTIAFSLGGGLNQRDGYLDSPSVGERTNDRDRWFARGQLLILPNDDLKVRLIADYSSIEEVCCGVLNLRRSPATLAVEALGGRVNDAEEPFADVAYRDQPAANLIDDYGVSAQIDYAIGDLDLTSITAYRRSEASSVSDADFTSADLVRIPFQDDDIETFTQEFRLASTFDGPVNFLVGGFYQNETIEHAARVEGGAQYRNFANALIGGSPANTAAVAALEAQFGALAGNPGLYAGRFFAAGQGLSETATLNSETYALFGQIDVAVSDRLTLTAGASYANDVKDYAISGVSTDVFSSLNLATIRTSAINAGIAQTVGGLLGVPGGLANPTQIAAFAAANPAAFAQISAGATAATAQIPQLRSLQILPPFLGVPNAIEDGHTDDSDWSYTLRAAYDVTDDLNVYLSYATGFKASSVNLSRDSRPSAADLARINAAGLGLPNLVAGSREAGPEDAAVLELGLKANWDMGSINVAVFDQSIDGFQSNIFTGSGFFLANAGEQSVRGFELEGVARPMDALSLSLGLTYLDAQYDDFRFSSVGDLSGRRPAGIPELSITIGGEYVHPIADGELILRGDYHYESEVRIVEGLPAFLANGGPRAAIAAGDAFEREVKTANASVTYALPSGLEFSVWGRNVFDDRYLTTVFDSVAQPLSVSGYSNQPRTFGLSVRARF